MGRGALLALALVALAAVGVYGEAIYSQEVRFVVQSSEHFVKLEVAFDVALQSDLSVALNGAVLPPGHSNVKVAGTVSARHYGSMNLDVEMDANVKVEADADEGLTARITLQSKVIAAAGKHLHRVNIRELVLEVHEDGTVTATMREIERGENAGEAPSEGSGSSEAPSHPGGHHHNGGHHNYPGHHSGAQNGGDGQQGSNDDAPVQHGDDDDHDHDDDDDDDDDDCEAKFWNAMYVASEWFHSLPFTLRMFIMFLVGVIAGFVFVFVLRFLFWAISCGRVPFFTRKCATKSCCQANYARNLQAHAGAYTAVAADEKEAKKAEEAKADADPSTQV